MASTDDIFKLVTEQRFTEIEDLWTEMVTDANIELDEYLSVTDAVHKTGDSSRATLLLELLSEHLESKKQYDKVIIILKHMLRYDRESDQIRKKLIGVYRKYYKDSVSLEEYLEYSGLNGSGPIMKAIKNFEDYIHYDVGRAFYFERYGTGNVVAVKPEKREIVVDFERKEKHFLTIDIAKGLLTPITKDHFLYIKQHDAEKLRSLAIERPVELIMTILRSFREPMQASRIKGYLEGIVDKNQLTKCWERTRKNLEKHDNIRVTGKASKMYSYVDSIVDKESQAIEAFHNAKLREKCRLAEEYARKMPQVFEKLIPNLVQVARLAKTEHPGIAFDLLMLFKDRKNESQLDYSLDDLLVVHPPENILRGITNPINGARLLSYLKDKDPNRWPDIASTILFAVNDFKIMDAVSERLGDIPNRLEDIYLRVLAMPKAYQKQFHWMLKKIESGELADFFRPNLIPKFIDSLSYVQGVRATMRKILTLKNFDEVMARAELPDARRIQESVKNSTELNDHEKSGYLRILEHHFPAIAEEKTDIIYSTEAALSRKNKELEHLLTVEIPANKKDISRAREFGDLSENFEYKAAKEKQDQLFAKVKNIESELMNVRVIDPALVTTDAVGVGTEVKLQNADDGSFIAYTILGRWDTDLSRNILSNEAPLAQHMLGKKVKDTVNINDIEYHIVSIRQAI
ncbi:MAG: GreA/GreB family elongation factor [candidate division WOR-3 bacterium]|nr:MAG: GreA/GreB family elongation factor [candidate division WOR-3 bacterium]